MQTEPEESTPRTAVLKELDTLETAVRDVLTSLLASREGEIRQVREKLDGSHGKLSRAKLHDLRDMLTTLRNTEFKTGKGRRKDLRKIDDVLSVLKLLTENW